MTAEHIEFLVEEPSMEATLQIILPRIIGGTSFAIYPLHCKQQLLVRLKDRLQGYAAWLPENFRIVVIVDRDRDDCEQLKQTLEEAAFNAGLVTRTQSQTDTYQIVNRIAIEELEAWFFGDWKAVREAYPRISRTVPNKPGFRDPDSIQGGTWEALERHLQRSGYFKTGLRKIEAAREIAQYMEPAVNRSKSFQVFRQVLMEMIA